MAKDVVCSVSNLCHSYGTGAHKVNVLQGVAVSLHKSEVTALVGPSGSGKSTLLHMLGLLEIPTSGQIVLAGQQCSGLSDAARTTLRGQHVGFVYQFHRLLPEFSCLENVMMPLLLYGMPSHEAQKRAAYLLEKVGLAHRLTHRPGLLSGGEQQRTAIARALVRCPALLIADEPTGNLDAQTADLVFELLIKTARDAGAAVLLATHDMQRAQRADRVLRMVRGEVVG